MPHSKKPKVSHKARSHHPFKFRFWSFVRASRLFVILSFLRNTSTYVGYLTLFTLGLAIGVSLLAYFSAGELYDYQDTISLDHLPEVDAIVCLGGGRGRISVAAELWNRYWELNHPPKPLMMSTENKPSAVPKVPLLYFSGMGRPVNWSLLSKQIRREIIQRIGPEDVIIERESSNTDANAQWLVRNTQNRHWNKIILLTSSYHMRRARFIFDQVLHSFDTPFLIETYSVYQEPFTRQEWRKDANGVRVTFIEYLKWIYYRAAWKPGGSL